MGVRVAANSSEEDSEQENKPPFPKTTPFHSHKPNPKTPSRRWSNLWLRNPNPNPNPLRHVFEAMNLPLSSSPPTKKNNSRDEPFFRPPNSDRTLLLPDQILLRILSLLPSSQRSANSLVCKRWLALQDRLFQSLKLLDWGFLHSGRLASRFANLTEADLTAASLISPQTSEIFLSHKLLSARIGARFAPELEFLPSEVTDRGLEELASNCPNLRKLSVVNASELGILRVAEECRTLQELELRGCTDNVLRGIAACENLQVLKLVGKAEGFHGSVVSDLGLTILAQGCKRLVRLELGGCEGSFDGVRAIGQCCHMLEELVLCDHRLESGWLAGLAYCDNLKTLKLVSCKRVDEVGPGFEEYFGVCSALERLCLERCQLRDKRAVGGLFGVCGNVKEIVFKDCWGLDNDVFSVATTCRRVRIVSLEGCSLLTTDCIESVILSWKEIESLRVVSCKNIKDRDISPVLSALFSLLKDLKWRPDPRSSLPPGILGTTIGKRGGKFFKRILDHKLLHFDL